jgi:hypothetical protein
MKCLLPATIVLLAIGCAMCQAAVPVVTHGKARCSIYRAPDAPDSVKEAAAELQRYVQKATGVQLPIVEAPTTPMLALGASPRAAKAGVTAKGLALEGFRIVTRGGNVYLLGPDTPNGQTTPQGGTSNGTRNGVYAFLERFLGVRWLMPGEHGDYVPHLSALTIPDTDITEAPFFLNRRVPYTQEDRPETKQWWARQRLGWSLYLEHSHNWGWPTAENFRAHPEWFAEQAGVRIPPSDQYSKLCPTNEGLIEAFAARAIRYFDENPEATCYSLSPSDGSGWCTCANCRALYEKDPNGDLSVTPAILSFYNRIAQIVARKYPNKVLAGYVYAEYIYPPKHPFKLAPNVTLVWAVSFDYGFTLFRPDIRKQWEELAPQWRKVTDRIAYYDLPNCICPDELGAINPPGLKILTWLFPRLKRTAMKGVYVYGNPAWGYAGPMNYLLAKLAWDPDADVNALFGEYLDKCYAEGAPEMKRLYTFLDDETEKYFNAHHEENYDLSEGRLRDIYVRDFPELERLYRAAEAKIREPEAKARLAMFGANLTTLHWSLRQFGMLDKPTASSFYLSDKDFFAFSKAWAGSLALAEPERSGRAVGAGQKLIVKPLAVPNAAKVEPFLLRDSQRLVLRPNGAGPAAVAFSDLTARGAIVRYQLYAAGGELVDQGVVSTEVPLALPSDREYSLLSISAGTASFRISVTNANWAVYARVGERGLDMLGETTPAYFEVPEGVTSFGFWLSTDAPGETAQARLYSPDGTEVAAFVTTTKTTDAQQIRVPPGQAGLWKVVAARADTGAIDDVFLKPGPELPGYFSLVPEQALSVIEAR